MKLTILPFFSLFLFFTSCFRHVYYVSPFNGNNISYHTLPLLRDSTKSIIFANSNLYTGSANTEESDKVFAMEFNISRSHKFSSFQAYYGINFSFGNYHVASVNNINNSSTINAGIINSMPGNKSFGGTAIESGINLVTDLGGGCEFRVIGLEAASHLEYGSYLNFREKLPDSAATLIARNKSFTTLGFYSEILQKIKKGSVGMKIAHGGILEKKYHMLY